jgi:hypothetical protein
MTHKYLRWVENVPTCSRVSISSARDYMTTSLDMRPENIASKLSEGVYTRDPVHSTGQYMLVDETSRDLWRNRSENGLVT